MSVIQNLDINNLSLDNEVHVIYKLLLLGKEQHLHHTESFLSQLAIKDGGHLLSASGVNMLAVVTSPDHQLSAADLFKIQKSNQEPLLRNHILITKLATDLLSTMSTKPKNIQKAQINVLARATGSRVEDIEKTIALLEPLSPISNYDILPFLDILESPICTHMVVEWIGQQLQVQTAFDRYIDMHESVPLLDLMIEIGVHQPLQTPAMFSILSELLVREFESISPLQQEEYHKVFMSYIVLLVKMGYDEPVFSFMAKDSRVEESFKVEFLKAIFGFITGPFDLGICSLVVDIFESIPADKYSEIIVAEAKESLVEMFKFLLDPFSDVDQELFSRAGLLKQSLDIDIEQ